MCALDRTDGAVDVGHRLVLGGLADQHLAVARERDDRRRGARALGVGDDDGVATFEYRDDGVGGPEVDSDRTSHGDCLLNSPTRGLSAPHSSLLLATLPCQPRLESSSLNCRSGQRRAGRVCSRLLFGPRRVVGFTGRHTESAAPRPAASSASRRRCRDCLAFADARHMMFGSDFPFMRPCRARSTSPTIWTTTTASTRQSSTRSTAPTRCHCFRGWHEMTD